MLHNVMLGSCACVYAAVLQPDNIPNSVREEYAKKSIISKSAQSMSIVRASLTTAGQNESFKYSVSRILIDCKIGQHTYKYSYLPSRQVERRVNIPSQIYCITLDLYMNDH